jgi:hypothetical protein
MGDFKMLVILSEASDGLRGDRRPRLSGAAEPRSVLTKLRSVSRAVPISNANQIKKGTTQVVPIGDTYALLASNSLDKSRPCHLCLHSNPLFNTQRLQCLLDRRGIEFFPGLAIKLPNQCGHQRRQCLTRHARCLGF